MKTVFGKTCTVVLSGHVERSQTKTVEPRLLHRGESARVAEHLGRIANLCHDQGERVSKLRLASTGQKDVVRPPTALCPEWNSVESRTIDKTEEGSPLDP